MSRLVSVVMPTYERQAKFLGTALESVLGQSYPSLELVVVSDGSREIRQVVDRFCDDPRLKVFIEKGRGYIAALNQGIELSQGDYVAFCDSDDILNRDHLKVLVDAVERHPDAGLVFDNLEYFDSESAELAADPAMIAHDRPLIDVERTRDLVKGAVSLQKVISENLISGPAFMVPRQVFNKVGLFDSDAFLMNDLHLFYRIGAYYPIRFVNYLGVRKRVHSGNLTTVHHHYEYGVKCLENIQKQYPDVCRRIGRRFFTKKLGAKYYRLGLHLERTGDQNKAKEMYKKAMFMRKFSLRNHWNYLRVSLLQLSSL
jgi:glycosyltransferase involved in cell wall biosynthesis